MTILLALTLVAAQDESTANFDDFVRLRDPAICRMNEAFDQFRRAMLQSDGAGRLRLGRVVVPPQLHAAFGRPRLAKVRGSVGTFTATIPVSGRWHGLALRRIAVTSTAEGDSNGFALYFQAPRETVRAAANAAGLAIPVTGSRSVGDELPTTIDILRDEGETVLRCHEG